jgi:hypothetical protein
MALVMASSSAAPAQDAAPSSSSLPAARLKFDRDLTQASLPETRQYIAELTALEHRAATARDYLAAMKLSQERKAAEAELAGLTQRAALLNIAQPSSPIAGIRLLASEAKLDGPIYDSKSDEISGWGKASTSATWMLPNLPPGGYDVVLHYSCAAEEGGSIVVKEAFYNLMREVHAPTKGIAQHALGTLRIREGSGPLTIAARTVLGGNLMHLHAVELLPASR